MSPITLPDLKTLTIDDGAASLPILAPNLTDLTVQAKHANARDFAAVLDIMERSPQLEAIAYNLDTPNTIETELETRFVEFFTKTKGLPNLTSLHMDLGITKRGIPALCSIKTLEQLRITAQQGH